MLYDVPTIVTLSQRTNDENSFPIGKVGQFKRFSTRVYFSRSEEIEGTKERETSHEIGEVDPLVCHCNVTTGEDAYRCIRDREIEDIGVAEQGGVPGSIDLPPPDWIMSMPLVPPWWWRVRL